MRKFIFIVFTISSGIIMRYSAIAQSYATGDLYIDYKKYFQEALQVFSSDQNFVVKNVKELQDSSMRLVDEAVPGINIKTLLGSAKKMDDEDIFPKRKNSVFIVGKLLSRKPNVDASFELPGTAFAINENGTCVTNYHVLKSIIKRKEQENENDSLYFIMTTDKKVYFIDKIIAYSQNNDIAVFRVNTRGDKLQAVPFGKPAKEGATVYCISHPLGNFYYLTKGIVARNVVVASEQAAAGFNPGGAPPIRMEITADYAVGSSGGPILDKYGNLVGMASSTIPVGLLPQPDVNPAGHQQMVVRDAIPVIAIKELLGIK